MVGAPASGRKTMAKTTMEEVPNSPTPHEMTHHVRDYEHFTTLFKWGAGICLLIGFVVLGVIVYQLWSPARRSQELVETGATYWHTVDFLWVIIFSLLYVVR